jgi:hypothetical protein
MCKTAIPPNGGIAESRKLAQHLKPLSGLPPIEDAMKILLLDDYALFHAGLRLLLSTIDRNLVTLEAGTVNKAIVICNGSRLN